MTEETRHELVKKAMDMRKFSYTPYSHYRVGAALLTKNGKIYGGCNIENAAYTPANCGERTAFFKAISEGEKEFEAIAIVGGPESGVVDYCPPCGVCRQVMMEKNRDHVKTFTLKELLPLGFGPADLEK